jgi:hypothetical protein
MLLRAADLFRLFEQKYSKIRKFKKKRRVFLKEMRILKGGEGGREGEGVCSKFCK